jgi:hypothetical protein
MGVRDVHRLLTHARELDIPSAPRRRSGTDAAFRSALSGIKAELAEIYRHATEINRYVEAPDDGGDEEVTRARTDLCLELASLLFAAGAPHPQWRWWASQGAGALLDVGNAQSAAVWALVAHDDDLVGRLPKAPGPGSQPERIVWWLASAPPSGDSHGAHESGSQSDGPDDDDVDAAWVTLLRSIPAADHRATGSALRVITDFWLDEDEDWEQFHPHFYPDFEPELNAVAALARRSGWEPSEWPPDALRFLEPGLAPGTPS